MSRGEQAAVLARGAVDWLIDRTRLDRQDPSLYHGLAGVALALHEAHRHFGDDRYREAAARDADALTAVVDSLDDCSLYFGLTGVAIALRYGRRQPGRTTSHTGLLASCSHWRR